MSPRSNTPPPGALHGTRRQEGGARREASERVVLRREGVEVMGWTLNLSRGGVRIIVEDPIELDGEYDILIGDEEGSGRKGRIVWIQDEADGQIAGVQFVTADGKLESGPPPKTDAG